MAEKKKQHIIPECYLKSFVDDTPPAGVSMELYEPAVWITDKSLKEASRRRAPNNVLWKNRYYNLEADNPSRPRIEEELAWLEGRYAKVLEALRRRHELSVRQAIEIALFVAVLFGRTNSFISNMQNQIDEIEHLYRQVDRAYNENESVSDEYWEGSSDGGKLSLILTGPALAQRLLSFGITVVVNESGVPFISSDNPVTYAFLHSDEVLGLSVPQEWLTQGIPTNIRAPFCFCPLSPGLGFMSSHFVVPPSATIYRTIDSEAYPVGMNFLTHESADNVLVSATNKPFVHHQDRIKRITEHTIRAIQTEGSKLVFYTDRARYEVLVTKYVRRGSHPLKPEIQFWTEDVHTVRSIAIDERIDLVEFYENGIQRGGTRNLLFRSVSLDPEEPSVLYANWI